MIGTVPDLALVIHMRDGRVDRVVSENETLRGIHVAVIDGDDAMLHRVALEAEIGEYVARARAGTQLYGLGTAAELAAAALDQIARTRYEAPRVALAAIQQVQQRLDQMCADAMALRSSAANDEPSSAAA